MNTPNSDNDNNNKNANESLQEEFTHDLNISAENEQSKIDRIVKVEREVETTQLVNENYDCNNHNKREGTNHTEDNLLLLTNINIISSSIDNNLEPNDTLALPKSRCIS
jgi:hypothetical protein